MIPAVLSGASRRRPLSILTEREKNDQGLLARRNANNGIENEVNDVRAVHRAGYQSLVLLVNRNGNTTFIVVEPGQD